MTGGWAAAAAGAYGSTIVSARLSGSGLSGSGLSGLSAPLSAAAFSTVLGQWGGGFVAVCLLLFAFTSLLGACYYGEQALSYLTGSRRLVPAYRAAFLCAVVVGSVGDVSAMWLLVDLSNGLMALPNLIALLLLSREAVGLINQYQNRGSPKGSHP